ncbi:DUF1642 domain-containing protein [Streptococcus uberis]|uniref:DUF1642 domain-containing protein n=1 Tax=Streptococcus uberis TaxID=1349 RepID=UPI00193A11E5|nr:DUF1642 domain-containing protein [Streptococcus uberis]
MKIEEAVKRIEQMGEYERFIDEPISKVSVLNTIRQINQQKPEVPQMIFDVIKKFKGENRSFYSLLENISAVKEAWEWLNMPKPGIKESELMKAWLAYPNITVQKEKLYTVEIPNPNIIGNSHTVLTRNGFKQIVMLRVFGDNWKTNIAYQLTEQEIRKDFDWAWQFAKEVTE